MLKLRPLEQGEESLWEKTNKLSPMGTFLTSIYWLNFATEFKGKGIDAYLIVNDQNVAVGVLPLEIHNRRFSKIASATYSPVLISEDLIPEAMVAINSYFSSYLKENDLFALRVHPYLKKSSPVAEKLKQYSVSLAPSQARILWEINLENPVEALRHAMSSSTRNNINKGERGNLSFVKVTDEAGVKEFADLMAETTQRKGFVNYDLKYFLAQFNTLNSVGMTEIYLVKKEGVALAGALVNVYKDTAYYTHGASTSDRELAKIRAPYFLQWSLMNEYKNRGFKKYNMWGVSPRGSKAGISGVSDFKRSFGGEEIELIYPIDIYRDPLAKIRQRMYDRYIYRNDRF
jgi:lipid II:glycine glycyltransferase (peptidoglycan interpeptide bridge formation enzyme)